MLELVAWHGTFYRKTGAMGHFARQQVRSCCAGRSASPCRRSGLCRSITDNIHSGGGCEGQGRSDSRWPPVARRRVHRDAGTASAADGQAGARELWGSFRPSRRSGLGSAALEDQAPLGLAHDRADRLAIAGAHAVVAASRIVVSFLRGTLALPLNRPGTADRLLHRLQGHICRSRGDGRGGVHVLAR
jgi:hypothetical protein